MYADDSTLHTVGKTVSSISEDLQSEMNKVVSWCDENKMVINTSKTKCMLITTKQKESHLNDDKLEILVNGEGLEQVRQEKLLGVTLDCNLDWSYHIDKVAKKVSSSLALFRRIRKHLPLWSRKLFYNCYIAPHMDYCVTVWGTSSDLSRLLKLQKQAARLILNCDFTVPSADMFKRLKWLPIHDWLKFRKARTVYNCLNGNAPSYLCQMFQTIGNVHSRCTRQSARNDLFLPSRAKLNAFRNSIRYDGATIWNSLPIDTRNATSQACFKQRCMTHLMKN